MELIKKNFQIIVNIIMLIIALTSMYSEVRENTEHRKNDKFHVTNDFKNAVEKNSMKIDKIYEYILRNDKK